MPDAVYQVAHVVYVVPEKYTREEGNEDDEQSLCGVLWMKVAKTDRQNNGSAEIVAPYVLFPPLALINILRLHPVVVWINQGYGQ